MWSRMELEWKYTNACVRANVTFRVLPFSNELVLPYSNVLVDTMFIHNLHRNQI